MPLTAPDGHTFSVYEQRPSDARAGVVVVQEIFGVNDHVRAVVDRYASHGYHTLAPALFDRVERGVELGYDQAGIAAGRALAADLAWDDAIADTATAVDHLAGTGPVAVVGYCYGGSVAWAAAAALPVAAAVGYYGGRISSMLDDPPHAPILLHFGEIDHAIPLAEVDRIRARYQEVPIHVYDGAGHGFNCDHRSSYHPDAAALAEARTLTFLEQHLR